MKLTRIIHSADCHGTSEAYSSVRPLVGSQALLLDAGDTIKGSNTAFRWSEPNLETMSSLGYHAMTMGNRELHYLPAILERREQQRNFPLLAANLVDLWGRQTTWQEGLSLRVGETRIAVFGMTVVQYPVGSLYEKIFGLRFLPPDTLIEYLVRKYQEEHDLVVFLSHLGLEWDRRLAQQIQEKEDLRCDFILGGHSHICFEEPEIYGRTRLSHVGSHSSAIGVWEARGSDWEFRLERVETP